MKKKKGQRKEEKVQRISKKQLTYAIIFLSLTTLVGFSLYMVFFHSSSDKGFSFKAAIIDHLRITYPNQTFRERATNMLKGAGYATVDYYYNESVTVEFYRNLPQHDYGLIILRTHSGIDNDRVCFFTSESYSDNAYQNYKNMGYTLVNTYLVETDKWYFGIPPKFVELNMNGEFRDTTFIVTGCDSANTPSMANALCGSKGAKAYIGWSGPLRVDLADNTTIYLLKTWLENQTIASAVGMVNSKISGNANYESKIDYYPKSVENYVIPKAGSIKTFAVWAIMFAVRERVGFSVFRNVLRRPCEAGIEERLLKS